MIGSVRGRLIVKRPDEVVVEAAGVGYQVLVGAKTLSELPDEGREVFLHIYTHLKDDAIELFGFATDDEKRVFKTLLGVSGIGPRVALSIVSSLPHDDFLKAVESEDIALLTKVPGLGKKTAHRLVLELRGKLPRKEQPRDRAFEDTVSALVNLGYKKSDALGAVEKAYNKGHAEIEALIRESLKVLTGKADEKA
ncbi:MAG: Holliday junction branch migration protein RuvA [Nitrospirota bacterium]